MSVFVKKQFFIVNQILQMRRRSSTLDQKVGGIEQFKPINQIKVYLRKVNRQTTIIKIRNKISGKNLLDLASQKANISLNNMVIFHKGQKIEGNEECLKKIYEVNQNDILHVHELPNIMKKSIKITLKPFQCSLQEINILQVSPKQKIGITFAKCIEMNHELTFVESGRKLNLQKTFQEEYIQNQSTIIVTTFNQENKEQPIQRKQKKDQFILQKKQKVAEFEDINMRQFKPKLRKTLSWSTTDNFNSFSFKKKQKPSIYKSQKLSQGKEVVWQSDSSSDLQRNLRKKLAIKKQKQIKHSPQIKQQRFQINNNNQQQDHIEVSDEQEEDHLFKKQKLFSSHDRSELQKELKKLLFSDLFQSNSKTKQMQNQKQKQKEKEKEKQKQKQMKQLQPPQMQTDYFLQIGETQQIQIKQQDIDSDESDSSGSSDQQQINMPKQLIKTSINLRESIGKSKGSYVVPMIPTRDLSDF